MSLVTRDVETLARALGERITFKPDTCTRIAQALIDSGAVTPLADAIEALADEWQQGEWSGALLMREPPVRGPIASAQAMTDWLRFKAAALRGGSDD